MFDITAKEGFEFGLKRNEDHTTYQGRLVNRRFNFVFTISILSCPVEKRSIHSNFICLICKIWPTVKEVILAFWSICIISIQGKYKLQERASKGNSMTTLITTTTAMTATRLTTMTSTPEQQQQKNF